MYINNIKVDEYQEKAILCNTNCLLIAGAGAGKTFTILGKINYLIENKLYSKDEILIISFTNKSVDDLKKKIDNDISIYTFHKLAIQILKDHHKIFQIASPDTLEYCINEFFQSLQDTKLIQEILLYFKETNYKKFLNTTKYKNLCKTIQTFISLFKTNDCNQDDLKQVFKLDSFLIKVILIIKKIYTEELQASNQMDFDDLIKEATKEVTKFYKYKYIIIDEFQDTSLLRWNLIYKLLKINNAKIFVVGDDFQSIYHFSGCNINLFLDFPKLVPNTTVLKLKYTYRNSQELINIAGKFILKNKKQVNKELISHKRNKKPIIYITYLNPFTSLERLLNKLCKKYEDILILGRNNKDINDFLSQKIPREKDYFLYKKKKIRYMTVHSSKGLEADAVIIINLIDKIMGFPNKIENPNIIEKINTLEDSFLYAEERRLFYVALTRTKNEVYLMCPIIKKSVFLKEIKKLIKKH